MPLLFLNGAEVEALLPMAECIEVVADALATLARGEALQPLRSAHWLPDRRGLLGVMPGYLGGSPAVVGSKVISVFFDNHRHGLDSHQGVVLLFEPEHGVPLAVLDAAAITAIRTAAASAVATRLLAREEAGDLALLGSGVQARTHLAALRAVRPLSRVRVWSRRPGRAAAFAAQEGTGDLPVEAVATARAAVEGADLVCTVTSAREPVLEGAWLAPGAHVNAVGACTPAARELDGAAVARCRLYVDMADPATLAQGVYTASAGNMAQGVAWSARQLGVAATAVVPDHAPATKLAAIERLGGRIVKVPFDRWWQVILEHEYPELPGLFVHPVSDPAVMAGNGTIALEILEDLPDVDTVLVPYGGGGLSCGIAAALRELRPEVQVWACEVATAAPLAASFAAGEPRTVDYHPSFVDGIGGKSVLAEMWPLASRLLAGSRVVPLDEVATAVRLLAERNRVIAEGAGATAVAAALAGAGEGGKVVCVVSGGNIDTLKLAALLEGRMP